MNIVSVWLMQWFDSRKQHVDVVCGC
jgi:hypothetical protein